MTMCVPHIQQTTQAGVAGVLGLAGASNVQGEQQKKLDVIANDVFVNLLRKSGQCCVLVRRYVHLGGRVFERCVSMWGLVSPCVPGE